MGNHRFWLDRGAFAILALMALTLGAAVFGDALREAVFPVQAEAICKARGAAFYLLREGGEAFCIRVEG